MKAASMGASMGWKARLMVVMKVGKVDSTAETTAGTMVSMMVAYMVVVMVGERVE